LSQLRMMDRAWLGHDVFFAVTGRTAARQLEEKYNTRVYSVGESNRKHPLRVLGVMCRCVGIILSERPDVVISTGAAHGCMLTLIGKLCGAKVVWIDSIANVERISLSGRIVRKFADLFLSQWPGVADHYRDVEYCGELI